MTYYQLVQKTNPGIMHFGTDKILNKFKNMGQK